MIYGSYERYLKVVCSRVSKECPWQLPQQSDAKHPSNEMQMAKSWRSKGDITPAVALALLLLFYNSECSLSCDGKKARLSIHKNNFVHKNKWCSFKTLFLIALVLNLICLTLFCLKITRSVQQKKNGWLLQQTPKGISSFCRKHY